MMSIIIEDGDLSATSVDQIPIINRRTVNTQAIVDEGQSLLIAGYSTQQSSDAVTGVPVLSDIPVLGHLFKYDEKKQVNMERFYLLTPRMVVPGASSGVDRTDVVTPEDK
jgi:type III secretion protein C